MPRVFSAAGHGSGSFGQQHFAPTPPPTLEPAVAPQLVAARPAPGAYRWFRTVTADNAGGAAKTDWPVRVDLTAANFSWAAVSTDGSAVGVRATDGTTLLPFWIEAWDKPSQTATIWIKFPSLAAGGTAQARIYYGAGTIGDAQDAGSVFTLAETFPDPASIATTFDDANGFFAGNGAAYAGNPIVAAVPSSWMAGLREQGAVVVRSGAPTGERYSLLFTGEGSTGENVGVTFSPDGETWTLYGSNPVLPNAEDPYVVLNSDGSPWVDGSGRMYVYFERKASGAQVDIGLARTTDFKTWEVWNGSAWSSTLTSHAIVLSHGGSGAWDEQFTGSPTVVYDGTQFVMLYEGATPALAYKTGVAFSTDGISWTKSGANPICTLEVPDELIKIGSTWWLFGHDAGAYVHRWKTTLDPGSWGSTSAFTLDDPFPWGGAGSSLSLYHDGTNRLTFYPPATAGRIDRFDAIGNRWKFYNKGFVAIPPTSTQVGVVSGVLKLSNAAAGSQIIMRTANEAIWTGNQAVRFRHRGGASTASYYRQIAVGNGTITPSLGPAFGMWGDGVALQHDDDNVLKLRGYAAGSYTGDIATKSSPFGFDPTVDNTHELRYLASNALAYVVNDAVVMSGANTAGATINKGLLLSQAVPSGGLGESLYDWIVARKYDGVDPAATLGVENGTPGTLPASDAVTAVGTAAVTMVVARARASSVTAVASATATAVLAPLAEDTFDRAAGALGTSSGGQLWHGTSFQIVGNTARYVSGSVPVWVEVGSADVVAKVTITSPAGNREGGLCFRYVDDANHWRCMMLAGTLYLIKVVGGVATTIPVYPGVLAEGTQTIKVACRGARIIAYADTGSGFVQKHDIVDTTHMTATKAGLFSGLAYGDTATAFDDFRVDRNAADLTVAHFLVDGYRVRNDDGDEATATWAAAANTPVAVVLDATFRLRVAIRNDGAASGATGLCFIEASKDGGATWTAASTASALAAAASSAVNDSATAQRISTGSFVAGRLEETPSTFGTAPSTTLPAGSVTEYEWVLKAASANGAAAGDAYALRVAAGSTFDIVVAPAVTATSAVIPASATVTAVGTAAVAMAVTRVRAAAVTGSGSVAAAPVTARAKAAAVTGAATVTSTRAAARARAVAVTATGVTAATRAAVYARQVAVSGAAAAVAGRALAAARVAAVTATGSTAVTRTGLFARAATVTAAGAAAAARTVALARAAAAAGVGSVAATRSVARTKAAAVTATGVAAAGRASAVTRAVTAAATVAVTRTAARARAGAVSASAAVAVARVVAAARSATVTAVASPATSAASARAKAAAVTATGVAATSRSSVQFRSASVAATGSASTARTAAAARSAPVTATGVPTVARTAARAKGVAVTASASTTAARILAAARSAAATASAAVTVTRPATMPRAAAVAATGSVASTRTANRARAAAVTATGSAAAGKVVSAGRAGAVSGVAVVTMARSGSQAHTAAVTAAGSASSSRVAAVGRAAAVTAAGVAAASRAAARIIASAVTAAGSVTVGRSSTKLRTAAVTAAGGASATRTGASTRQAAVTASGQASSTRGAARFRTAAAVGAGSVTASRVGSLSRTSAVAGVGVVALTRGGGLSQSATVAGVGVASATRSSAARRSAAVTSAGSAATARRSATSRTATVTAVSAVSATRLLDGHRAAAVIGTAVVSSSSGSARHLAAAADGVGIAGAVRVAARSRTAAVFAVGSVTVTDSGAVPPGIAGTATGTLTPAGGADGTLGAFGVTGTLVAAAPGT